MYKQTFLVLGVVSVLTVAFSLWYIIAVFHLQ